MCHRYKNLFIFWFEGVHPEMLWRNLCACLQYKHIKEHCFPLSPSLPILRIFSVLFLFEVLDACHCTMSEPTTILLEMRGEPFDTASIAPTVHLILTSSNYQLNVIYKPFRRWCLPIELTKSHNHTTTEATCERTVLNLKVSPAFLYKCLLKYWKLFLVKHS